VKALSPVRPAESCDRACDYRDREQAGSKMFRSNAPARRSAWLLPVGNVEPSILRSVPTSVLPCFLLISPKGQFARPEPGSPHRSGRRIAGRTRGIDGRPLDGRRGKPRPRHVDEAGILRTRNRPVAAGEAGGGCVSDRRRLFWRRGLLGRGRLRSRLLETRAVGAAKRDQ
jgi:hypothetical protein